MTYMPVTQEFLEKAEAFRAEWYKRYESISHMETPEVDGKGVKIIRKRPDGYNYIEEEYMRSMLDKHFPGWSWEMAAPLHFLGAEWVVAQGHLIIIDEHLLAYGVQPPVRKFYGTDSVRIQFKHGAPHTAENIVDVGDNCKQANTAAMKYSVNRLCRIGDDVYGKRREYEGAGSYDSIVETNPDATTFADWVTKHKGNWTEIMCILGVAAMTEVKDWSAAYVAVKQAKGW